jgi:type I restriction enzyme S subunit
MTPSWNVSKLGEICDFEGGSQPPKSQFIYSGKPGYVRFLQIRDFRSDRNKTYVRESEKNRLCADDDILIGRYGASVGKILSGKAGAYNVALVKTIPDERVLDRRWLYHYLLSHEFQNRLLSVAARSAQNGFSKEDIYDFPVPVPGLPEQRRIVGILDKAFDAVAVAKANAERNIRNIRELFESRLSTLVNEDHSEWASHRLAEVTTKIGSGATPKGGGEAYAEEGVSFIRSLNVHDLGFRFDRLAHLNNQQAIDLSNVEVRVGDVLLNITGASVARCCVVPNEVLPARVSQHVSIIRPKSDQLDSHFLHYVLISRLFKDRLLDTGRRGGATRQAITKAQIQDFTIRYPRSLVEQRRIAQDLDSIRAQCELLSSNYDLRTQALSELKSAILRDALAGRL